MVHDPKAVANWFIGRGISEGSPLTHIEVQKLMYFSHGWMLGIHEQPLHHGVWEAWRYGPVLPEIYFKLNYNQGEPITSGIPVPPEEFTDEELSIMNVVYGYRRLGTSTLIGMAHSRGGPWDQVWCDRGDSGIISNEMMRPYFSERAVRD